MKLLRLALSMLLFAASFTLQAESVIRIKDAWIPEAPPVSRVLAGFATFHNKTNNTIEITALSSPNFSRIEMHLSKEVDGMARMIPQKSLTLPANSSLELKHGSYHLMLFNPKKRLRDGDKVTINMNLSNGQQQTFTMAVRKKMNSQQHDHSHHHHMHH